MPDQVEVRGNPDGGPKQFWRANRLSELGIGAKDQSNHLVAGEIKTLSLDKCVDYAQSINGLPATDMLHCIIDEQSSFVLRPSGTEPKLKSYIFVKANSHDEASSIEQNIANALAEEVNL